VWRPKSPLLGTPLTVAVLGIERQQTSSAQQQSVQERPPTSFGKPTNKAAFPGNGTVLDMVE